eukprot:3493465-Alexandrium_andersonii.AAC.1
MGPAGERWPGPMVCRKRPKPQPDAEPRARSLGRLAEVGPLEPWAAPHGRSGAARRAQASRGTGWTT